MPSGANNQRKQLAMLAAAEKEEEEKEDSSLQTQGEKSNIITSQNNHSNRSIEAVHKNEVREEESKDLNVMHDQDEESSDYENSDDEAETDGEVEHSDNITDIDDDEIGEEFRNLPNLGTLIDIPSVSSFHLQKSEVLKTRSSVWNCCGLLDLFKGSQ